MQKNLEVLCRIALSKFYYFDALFWKQMDRLSFCFKSEDIIVIVTTQLFVPILFVQDQDPRTQITRIKITSVEHHRFEIQKTEIHYTQELALITPN